MRPKRNPFEVSFEPQGTGEFGPPLGTGEIGESLAPDWYLDPALGGSTPAAPPDGGQGGYGPGPRYSDPAEKFSAEGAGTYGEGGGFPAGPRFTDPGQIATAPPDVQAEVAAGTQGTSATPGSRPRPRSAMVGHLGGLPPIAPQYSQWESVDELAAAYDSAKADLRQKAYFDGSITLDEYRTADDNLEKERAQAIAQQQAFEGSVPGKQLGLARHQLATAHEQQEFQAQELDRDAWAAQMRASQTKDARRQLDEQAAEAAQRRTRIEARIEGEMLSYKNALRDLERSTIDPYGGEKGSGKRIAAAIAIGLGTVGSAMGGGQNMVMPMIQAQVDREVQAQIVALENKKAGVAGRVNMVGMLRERLGDTDRAESAAKAHIYSQLELRVKTVEETAKSQIIQTRAKALRTELGRRKDEFEQAAALQAQVQAEALEQKRAQAIAWAHHQQAKADEQAELAAQGVIDVWGEGDFPKGAAYVEGIGIVGTGSLADKTIQRIQASKEVERLADEIQRQGKVGWENMARKEQLLGALTMAISQEGGLGALDDGTRALVKEIVGNPNMPWGETQARASQLVVQTQRKRADMINSLGPIEAHRRFVTDPKSGRKQVKYFVTGTPGAGKYNVNPVTTK